MKTYVTEMAKLLPVPLLQQIVNACYQFAEDPSKMKPLRPYLAKMYRLELSQLSIDEATVQELAIPTASELESRVIQMVRNQKIFCVENDKHYSSVSLDTNTSSVTMKSTYLLLFPIILAD